jgi:hypothetical protein
MDQQPGQTRQPSSFLFTLRVWHEQLGVNQSEWRGQVEHLMSGKTCYFRGWSTLVSFLEETLAILEQDRISTKSTHSADQDNGSLERR